MIQNATLKDCDKKLKRSKFEIENNNQKIKDLQEEKQKLILRFNNLKAICGKQQQSCQKIEHTFIKQIQFNQEEQDTLSQQETELNNLRNDQIKLINNEQITKNQLIKNNLLLKDLQEQCQRLNKKKEDISSKVRLQEQIRLSLQEENLKILQGLQNIQDKNKVLNTDIVNMIDSIQKETTQMVGIKSPKSRQI